MSFNLKEGALIRKVVNESLVEGIVTEDLVEVGGKNIKQVK